MRRASILPPWIQFNRSTRRGFIAAIFGALLLSAGVAHATDLPGLDETAFEDTARHSGHPPSAPLLDLGGAQPAAMLIAFFTMGLVVGTSWHRLRERAEGEP